MAEPTCHPFGRSDSDLGALTGVRSGKRSFYSEYRRSAERLEQTVRALDRISGALVRTAEGPRGLVEAVARTAADHLHAEWVLVAVADGALPAARPRSLFVFGEELVDHEQFMPSEARPHLHVLRARPWAIETRLPGQAIVRVAMMLDSEPVGGIAALPARGMEVAETDLAILRVLANQAAVALHNSFLLHATCQLRGRAEQLSETTVHQARDLAARSAELAVTQQRLMQAMQRQALDDERHRIARELHDSVTQDVLSAGMTIEVCRAELADSGADLDRIAGQLSIAKDLTRRAVERLRAAIYALYNAAEEQPGCLPDLLERLSEVHLPSDLKVQVRVVGRPVPLPAPVEHSLLRLTGEALFNIVMHSSARQALVRLEYRVERLVLSVSDDGDGDPVQLRKVLRFAARPNLVSEHRGLANMQARAREWGGDVSIRRSRLGGVMLLFEIPLPVSPNGGPT